MGRWKEEEQLEGECYFTLLPVCMLLNLGQRTWFTFSITKKEPWMCNSDISFHNDTYIQSYIVNRVLPSKTKHMFFPLTS